MSDGLSLDVVIVNWNAGDRLQKCVESVAKVASTLPGLRTCVVDNASTDNSLQSIRESDVVHVIRNEVNIGFAAACNVGARAGSARFILFLNPDTEVHEARTLTRPAAFLADNPSSGVCGVQLRNEDGTVARTSTRFPTPRRIIAWSLGLDRIFPRVFEPQFFNDFDHESDRVIDVVMGAFFYMKRTLFERLNGFDERFFVYYEEVDFARRAAMIGQSTCFLSELKAVHAGHGTTDQIKAARYFLSSQSRMKYARKHFGPAGSLLSLFATSFLEPPIRVAFSLSRGNFAGAQEALKGSLSLWSWIGRGMPLMHRPTVRPTYPKTRISL